MAQSKLQPSFHSGEWAPTLYARVDLEKYKAGAALLENFFSDYRGGASTRPGTRYILRALKSATAVRIITFQASTSIGYILEFGDFYIRFYSNGAPVLETGLAITGATNANPCVVSVTNSYTAGDWVFISGVAGMTQLNGKYYVVHAASGGTITLYDLFGNPVDATAYGIWSSGGTVQRVYTIGSPYAAADLALLKFVQNETKLVLTHHSYVPYELTIISPTNWTLNSINFGATITVPIGITVGTSLSSGSVNYSYTVTAVDGSGQESSAGTAGTLASKQDLRTTSGTNTVTWSAVTGAVYYNVYKAEVVYGASVPAGAAFGFAGFCTGLSFVDSNIAPDFTETPPVARNPFQGAGVQSITITNAGSYTAVPGVTIADAPGGGTTATGSAVLQAQTATIVSPGNSWSVGDPITFSNGIVMIVASVSGGVITSVQPFTYPGSSRGAVTSGSTPSNPVLGSGHGTLVAFNFTWGVGYVNLTSNGAGYTSVPAVTFSAGAAAGTAVLAPSTAGNPAVPGIFQQRLVFGNLPAAPQQINFSKPGSPYNFNESIPVQPDDAIQGSLNAGQLNSIKAFVPMQVGLLVFTDRAAWVVNGGASGAAVAPATITTNPHSYIGISDVPPIVANFDVLFVQAKASIVRDLAYNFYTNVFTGTDISLLSSQLFFGFTINEWAWAEEPYKVVWSVRNDGVLLSLTFLKEQELISWCHSVTDGNFKSVATVTEQVDGSLVDATYFVIERTINSTTVKYIERLAERVFTNGVKDAWCVDAGLQYSGAPATSFSGGEHLVGKTCTGLADGVAIPSFVMPASGNFTLATPASKVTVGLGFTAKLKTLPLDLGEPTVQGKPKKIPAVDILVADTLGLSMGSSFNHLVAMKDLIVGNVSSMLAGQDVQIISDLVSGQARIFLDPTYTVPGQYCIQQSLPLPATILGVVPQITVGDTPR